MTNGRYLSDKSYKYDTIFFVSKYLYDLLENKNTINISTDMFNNLVSKIANEFNLPENSYESNRNYILETLSYLEYALIIKKREQTQYTYDVLNLELLEFLTVSIENTYIFQYLVSYQTFVNDGLWNHYIDYLQLADKKTREIKLQLIKDIMCKKAVSIGDPDSVWASNVVKFSIMVLGLANGDKKVTRTLQIKEDNISPKDLSANVEGTRTTTAKQNSYIRSFRLNYVKSFLDFTIAQKFYGNNQLNQTNYLDTGALPEFDFASSSIKDGQNLVVYGTPGCGKSYYVQNVLLKDYGEGNYIRTTFFQDYTNTDFVGQILPCAEKDENGKDVVTYIFNPGPFTLALEKAIRKPNERIALVIEELNRGSAASIFGDIFQLLDRKDGISEYSITNVNIIDYLKKQFKDEYTFNTIKLPGNFSIFATMNTSDQNVFTLDTAFKRRWKFKKLLNKFESDHKFKDMFIPGADITWKDFVEEINKFILESTDGFNGEDKQIGVYFVDEKGMRKDKLDPSDPIAVEEFAYKVLEYLWDDVTKFARDKWFEDKIKSLDELVDEYKTNGVGVFKYDVFHK